MDAYQRDVEKRLNNEKRDIFTSSLLSLVLTFSVGTIGEKIMEIKPAKTSWFYAGQTIDIKDRHYMPAFNQLGRYGRDMKTSYRLMEGMEGKR